MRALDLASSDGDLAVSRVSESVAVRRPLDSCGAAARLVGSSPAMRALRDRLALIARARGSVLICGASGTGKELAARIVHDASSRSKASFVAVDCGSLAEGVLESELFGHVRGAFTNAMGDRRGLFEEADGGTIFLDEIGNTSLAMQARLLRVLQEREVRRVGCNRARRVDVRVIAATNRDLAQDAAAGRFREDLLYRLDVLPVVMPPLVERRDDVIELAAWILEDITERGPAPRLSPLAVAALLAHDWPGNVRELRNVLERASAFVGEARTIEMEHLPERFAERALPAGVRPALMQIMDAYERSVLAATLQANRWNRTRTAQEFGITRRCLFNKITKHALRPPA